MFGGNEPKSRPNEVDMLISQLNSNKKIDLKG